ncbi:MAG: glycosyltransferase family 2 protein [Deltaproteobacteria bacterium]|nr:glycosyltransferase family 2 protein [Deltaproteobacteria bacterium]
MTDPRARVRLTGVVVAKDEAGRIEACLDALSFCDERIVVLDAASSDGTAGILEARDVRTVVRPFVNMNDQKDFGRSIAEGTWVLNVDADEVVSDHLKAQVLDVLAQDPPHAAFRIPFRNHLRNVWIRRCGYYPDYHVRLVRRDRAHWDKAVPVHDRVVVEGTIGTLSGPIDHYSFESVAHFLKKSADYAERFAIDAHARGRRAGLLTIGFHTAWRFFKTFVLRGGFLEGTLGLVISGLQAYEVFQKYVRLWERSRFSISTSISSEGRMS